MSRSVAKKISCAHSEDIDQRPPSLISVFNVHIKELRYKLPIKSSLDRPSPGDDVSRVMRKPTFWFPTWSDTNQAVQLQKTARGLKFHIYKVKGLYYLCSENKGADQLCGYRTTDMRLCFRICKMLVFS